MSDRIDAIRKMLDAEPGDVFLHYSLGMELASAERYGEAARAFRRCIELDESYLAAYVEWGKALRSAGDLAGAREAFTAALNLAAEKGDAHVRDHVQQQLDALGA